MYVGLSASVIAPRADYDKFGIFDIESAGNQAFNVTGQIVAPANGIRAKPGDDIWYQYNALMEAPSLGDFRIVETGVIYKAGRWMLNDWIFGILNAEDKEMREFTILSVPRRSYYEMGMRVIVPRKLSHKVLPRLFSDDKLYAFYQRHVIAHI